MTSIRSIARTVTGWTGAGIALAAIVYAAPGTPAPAGAAVTTLARTGCHYAVHVDSTPDGGLRTYVTGTCNGHAPFDSRIARDLAMYVLPSWLHVTRPAPFGRGGPCVTVWGAGPASRGLNGTSALVCADGTAYTS